MQPLLKICRVTLPHMSWKVVLSRDEGAGLVRNFLPILDVCCYGNHQTSRTAKVEEIDKESLNHLDNVPVEIKPHSVDNTLIKQGHTHKPGPTVQWQTRSIPWSKLPHIYLRLSKYKLTTLVVMTTLAGSAMTPCPLVASTMLCCCVGTALCSAAANTINQWMEIPFDSQMARTRNRVLVRGQISQLHALTFAAVCGTGGYLLLLHTVNPLTASLGLLNLVLYTSLYTPLKRISILNTWAGSVVGAIPPIMGWTACTGVLDPGCLILGAILYAWQFPHFNSLSWSHRGDYSRGGYRMMSVTNPTLCRRVALRYSLLMIPICTATPLCDLTTWWFALDSLPLNLYLSYLSWNFYRDADFKSAKLLFRFSLLHLPLLLALLFVNKKHWSSQTSNDNLLNSSTPSIAI